MNPITDPNARARRITLPDCDIVVNFDTDYSD